jgi:hypothetical protein
VTKIIHHLLLTITINHVADHVVSTMAAAQSAGVLALGQLWWADVWQNATSQSGNRLIEEIVRQGQFLAKTWDAETKQVLVGVGGQINPANDTLYAYQDFGTADRALMVGPPPADNKFGQPTTVAPECSWSSSGKPAGEVAAHAAAALALASHVAFNHTVMGTALRNDWLLKAQALLDHSMRVSPIQRPGSGTDVLQRHGVRFSNHFCCHRNS